MKTELKLHFIHQNGPAGAYIS